MKGVGRHNLVLANLEETFSFIKLLFLARLACLSRGPCNLQMYRVQQKIYPEDFWRFSQQWLSTSLGLLNILQI